MPGQHIWVSVGPDPSSSSPKQWKSDGHAKIYNFVSARSPLTKLKEKLYREKQYIRARVSAVTGSVPRKLAKGQQRVFSNQQELNPTHPTQIRVIHHAARL